MAWQIWHHGAGPIGTQNSIFRRRGANICWMFVWYTFLIIFATTNAVMQRGFAAFISFGSLGLGRSKRRKAYDLFQKNTGCEVGSNPEESWWNIFQDGLKPESTRFIVLLFMQWVEYVDLRGKLYFGLTLGSWMMIMDIHFDRISWFVKIKIHLDKWKWKRRTVIVWIWPIYAW